MIERNVNVNDEQNRHEKALLDIRTNCHGHSQLVTRRPQSSAPSNSQDPNPIRAEEVITPEGRKLMFKLGAEMNQIASEQNTAQPRRRVHEGAGRLGRQHSANAAQKPGVPVEQMAKGFLDQ